MQHEKAVQLAHATEGPDRTRDLNGEWHGEHGAVMELKMDGAIITGMFRTDDGSTRHHIADITGVAVGDLICLTGLWRMGGSITSWSGQYEKEPGEPETLKLMWRLITEMTEPIEPKAYWMSSFGGAEEFKRLPADAGLGDQRL